MIEQSLEFRQRLSINFIDFIKAFDSIHRETLWKIARTYGVPQDFVAIFKNLYEGSECCIRTEDGDTSFFKIRTGVRQGCVLSPMLFLLAIDFICRHSIDTLQLGIDWAPMHRLADLDFADDIALLGKSQPALRNLTAAIETQAAKVGLRISESKTKVIRFGYSSTPAPITINGRNIEEVTEFTYLGSTISATGDSTRDTMCRIGKALAVFQRLRPIWDSASLSLPTKLRIFSAIVIPTALYASETWKKTVAVCQRLDAFHQRCLRRILKITYRDRVTNEEVYGRTGTRPLSTTVTERRLKFAGHILRLPDHRLPKYATRWRPKNGRRGQGRPRTTWRRTVIEDLSSVDTDLDNINAVTAAAEDRARWRALVARCAERRGRV